jgi:small subunit ribosomal protein S14
MAKTSKKVMQARLNKQRLDSIVKNVKMPMGTRYYNRCKLCGRVWSYIRDFWICRVCLRKYAREWLIMGLRKASW